MRPSDESLNRHKLGRYVSITVQSSLVDTFNAFNRHKAVGVSSAPPRARLGILPDRAYVCWLTTSVTKLINLE